MENDSRKLLLAWQDEVMNRLVEGFRQLFDSSSEVLLEFADAAENNRLQRLFFDAQREFYLKEETIISDFEQRLRDQLGNFSHTSDHAAQLGAETLSLVDVEDYERSLALETIAKRTADKQQPALHALSQRLSALFGGRPIPVDDVPAHPLQVIRTFDPASRKLEVEKEVRLVFYTLFDRYVMSRLGGLYQDLNQRLVDLGILPNIKFDYQRYGGGSGGQGASGAADGADDPSSASAGAEADAGDMASDGTPPLLRPATPSSIETLAAISSLLMAKRQAEQYAEPLRTSVPILPTAANIGEAIADARVLEEAPHPVPMGVPGYPSKVAIDADLLMKVKGALERQRLIIKNLVGRDKLDRREEDVIDIVGMLFEAMLNEKLLPNSVKTLLSHLHTRYLKIAVQSPDFLDNTDHPARRLFERMLDVGIRWVREDNLRVGIYPLLQEIVTRILRTENPPDSFFDEQITLLEKEDKRLEKQSSATEERTLEAERGRARLDQAKSMVSKTVADLTAGTEIAEPITQFLRTTFADYLTLLLLRSDLDTESDAWNAAYNTGEALVAAAAHAADRNSLGDGVRQDLTKRLLASVGSLIPHHEDNIRRVVAAIESPPPEPVAVPPAPAEAAPQPPAKPAIPPTARQKPAAEPVAAIVEEPVDEEDRKVADKLMREAGNWFVMKREGDTEEQAVKLLWVNPHTRNMLFVDQQGAKVALMPANNVARMMREGTVRPMQQETSSFVARSLRRIRRALEDSVNA